MRPVPSCSFIWSLGGRRASASLARRTADAARRIAPESVLIMLGFRARARPKGATLSENGLRIEAHVTMSLTARIRIIVRRAITNTARDVSLATAGRSALILAPHPDDETLGCGGTVLRKLAAGSAVTIAVVTDGRHSHASALLTPPELAALRRNELAEAAKRLGVSESAVCWLGFEDGTVAANEDAVAAAIATLIAKLVPSEVYSTSADEPHPDHAAVGRAARKAVAASAGTHLLEYPVWLWGNWPLRPGDRIRSTLRAMALLLFRGAVVVRVNGLESAKWHALSAHASQLGRPASIPESEPWGTLPTSVLNAAAEPVELFFPVCR